MQNFSPQSKVWVYQSNRAFTADEAQQLNTALDSFARQWAAHNIQLKAWAQVLHQRFVVLMVDETQTTASGCSIDTSVHFIKDIENKLGVQLFNRMLVAYMDGEELKTTTVNELEALIAVGQINANTTVFNNLVATKQQFDEQWQTPLAQSWMKRYLPTQTT
jgi:hypothetical protein